MRFKHNKKKDRKFFSKNARKVHPKNRTRIMRGGYRI